MVQKSAESLTPREGKPTAQALVRTFFVVVLSPLRRRLDAVFIQDPLDSRPADLVAEEAHHVPDSCVAPAHVLLGQPDDEVPNVLRLRRTPRAALGVAIVLGARVLAEPPGQRVWGDERAELPKLGVGEGRAFRLACGAVHR